MLNENLSLNDALHIASQYEREHNYKAACEYYNYANSLSFNDVRYVHIILLELLDTNNWAQTLDLYGAIERLKKYAIDSKEFISSLKAVLAVFYYMKTKHALYERDVFTAARLLPKIDHFIEYYSDTKYIELNHILLKIKLLCYKIILSHVIVGYSDSYNYVGESKSFTDLFGYTTTTTNLRKDSNNDEITKSGLEILGQPNRKIEYQMLYDKLEKSIHKFDSKYKINTPVDPEKINVFTKPYDVSFKTEKKNGCLTLMFSLFIITVVVGIALPPILGILLGLLNVLNIDPRFAENISINAVLPIVIGLWISLVILIYLVKIHFKNYKIHGNL